MSGVTPGLRALLGKLTAFKVTNWGPDSSAPSTGGRVAADLVDAQVTSSLIKGHAPDPLYDLRHLGEVDFLYQGPMHQVVVDIDWPAHLVESSTPNHFHLYVEIPGGVAQRDYFAWLDASAKIGLIEPGYVDASKTRGHTDVRLPWVTKDQTPPTPVEPLEKSHPDSTRVGLDCPTHGNDSDRAAHAAEGRGLFSTEHGPDSGRPQDFNDIVIQQHNHAVARSGRLPAPGF